MIDYVIKIGGSLFPDYAIELVKQLEGTNTLIILGGGEFANLIRKYDEELEFSPKVSHQTAIEAMGILAQLVDDKVQCSRLVYSIDQAIDVSDKGYLPILIVDEILKKDDPFKYSWEVTSDSISAYVANLLNANLLIVTNVNGIYTREPKEEGSKFIDIIDAKKLLTFDESSIDLMLPSLLIEFGTNCYVVNGMYPERVLSLIDDNIDDYNFKYTQIIGD